MESNRRKVSLFSFFYPFLVYFFFKSFSSYMNEYKQKYELYRKEMSLKYQKSAETSQDDSVKIVN